MKTISASILFVIVAIIVCCSAQVIRAQTATVSNDAFSNSECSGVADSSNTITFDSCLSNSCPGDGRRACAPKYKLMLIPSTGGSDKGKMERRLYNDDTCEGSFTVDSDGTYALDTCIDEGGSYFKYVLSGATTTTASPGSAGALQGFAVAAVVAIIAAMMMMA